MPQDEFFIKLHSDLPLELHFQRGLLITDFSLRFDADPPIRRYADTLLSGWSLKKSGFVRNELVKYDRNDPCTA
jgi:hypothetical protein